MAKPSIESVQKELQDLRQDVEQIKRLLQDELSDEAKKGLAKARRTPESEYVDL